MLFVYYKFRSAYIHVNSHQYSCLLMSNTSARDLAKNDPALFLQQYPPPVIIDEIQYAQELFSYISSEVTAIPVGYL